MDNTFTLSEAKNVSAGEYDANGRLLREILAAEPYPAGTHQFPTDGVAPGNTVRIEASNIYFDWVGTIGNTSHAYFGKGVHTQLNPWRDATIVNGNAYFCSGDSEAHSSVAMAAVSRLNYRMNIFPFGAQQGTNALWSDGVTLYTGGRYKYFDDSPSYVQAVPVDKVTSFDNFLPFQGERMTYLNRNYAACDIYDATINGVVPDITGLAGQVQGNYLYVARADANSIHVLHKITGEILHEITAPAPGKLAMRSDTELWGIFGTVLKSATVNADGSLSAFVDSPLAFERPMAIDVGPDYLAVVDARRAGHQVFTYDENGAEGAPLGRAESYIDDATVYDNKMGFYDNSSRGAGGTYVVRDEQGRYHVGDVLNRRYLVFDAAGAVVDSLYWLNASYSTEIDLADPTRVFSNHKEYKVDWTKEPTPSNDTGFWRLTRNYGLQIPAAYYNDGLGPVATFPNGRTYCIGSPISDADNGVLMELDPVLGPIVTDVQINKGWSATGVFPDGQIRYKKTETENGVTMQYLRYKEVTGYAGPRNAPVYGDEITFAAVNRDVFDMSNVRNTTGHKTASGEWVTFRTDKGSVENPTTGSVDDYDHYHLASFREGDPVPVFQASLGYVSSFEEEMPAKGRFEVGAPGISSASRRGTFQNNNPAAFNGVADRFVGKSAQGEFWRASFQVNIRYAFSDRGLFVTQTGVTARQFPERRFDPKPKMLSGNGYSGAFFEVPDSDEPAWVHCDEGHKGAVLVWRLRNTDSFEDFEFVVV
ncbi:hypothetical protein [Neolewinella antarctica]|uniref:Uncharacterized protein n=1 Tax=Neolewinella antarctica TaxID=442734 RepID=A0ABX0X7H0_9BACT|nr:hypothetical protein [Neolewinella antarctica]NJC24813.1 hypothetical protein [Neolewinella antarctica]